MLSGRKLALTLAFTVIVALAFGVSCRGFFTNPTINTFVITPASATVPLDGTFQMHAFGTDSNGNPTGDITNKVSWSSNSGAVTVGATTGLLQGVSLSPTAATITGSYQALSSQTASAAVCVENGGSFAILPSNDTVSAANTSTVQYTASAVVAGQTEDITAGVQWTSSNTAVASIVNGSPAVATITAPTSGTTAVVITASYSCGSSLNTFTTNLTVEQ